MIYTITFNPALDYTSEVENFKIGEINRTKTEEIFPGGKGLNVSMILKNLGFENTALGFIAGFTGRELQRIIREKGIEENFIEVEEGFTRINVKIRSNVETALNGNGPIINEKEQAKLLEMIDNITEDDYVVLSGNTPKCVDSKIYEVICDKLSKKKVPFIVDATQTLLLSVLKYNPFMIKPNREELIETLNVEINTREDYIKCANMVQEMGAQNVLISLGGDGAMLVTKENEVYYSKAPEGERKNTVGAGDSMVAGFLAGYLENKDYRYAFKMGMAAGTATACSNGLATKEEIRNYFNKIINI